MSLAPREVAAPTAVWTDLVAELDRWVEAGRVATFWWRDDDAIEPTGALNTLLDLARDIPMTLAVIPATTRPALADALAAWPHASVAQHGWRHANHAGGGKKTEYPAGRNAGIVAAEIAAGQARLRTLFGDRVTPLFVPPWNRVASEFLPLLPAFGITGLSTMASRHAQPVPPGLTVIDAHLDVVDWHGDRRFVGEAPALAALVDQLQTGRLGNEPEAPLGILTHHLVMDCAAASFLKQLVATTGGHAGARWAAIGELLASA